MNLNETSLNNTYKIYRINNTNDIKKRLEDLGFIKNTSIIPIYRSIFNDPTGYLIKGSIIALRDEDAKNIIVYEKDDKDGAY